jgi:CheY-like chemotaxis protein
MGSTSSSRHRRSVRTDPDLTRLPPRRDDRPRVLLVDDSAEHRDLYALMLEPTASVVTASGGEEALKIAGIDAPDVIVLDVLMPHMDGWEVCRRLKGDVATSGIPVIMLTSLEETDIGTRADRSGAAAVLMKPCPVERLASAVTEAATTTNRRVAVPEIVPSRRWTRKTIAAPVAMRLGDLPARLVNVSYGGLCVEIVRAPDGLPMSFDVTFPVAGIGVHADAVWLRRGADEHWVCGAQISNTNDWWRGWVDKMV